MAQTVGHQTRPEREQPQIATIQSVHAAPTDAPHHHSQMHDPQTRQRRRAKRARKPNEIAEMIAVNPKTAALLIRE